MKMGGGKGGPYDRPPRRIRLFPHGPRYRHGRPRSGRRLGRSRLLAQSDFALTELSLAGDFSIARLVGLLSDLQGPHRYGLPLDLLFARAGALLESDPGRCAVIIRDLQLLCVEERLPRGIKARLLALDGTSSDGSEALREFLAPYAGYCEQLKELVG